MGEGEEEGVGERKGKVFKFCFCSYLVFFIHPWCLAGDWKKLIVLHLNMMPFQVQLHCMQLLKAFKYAICLHGSLLQCPPLTAFS